MKNKGYQRKLKKGKLKGLTNFNPFTSSEYRNISVLKLILGVRILKFDLVPKYETLDKY